MVVCRDWEVFRNPKSRILNHSIYRQVHLCVPVDRPLQDPIDPIIPTNMSTDPDHQNRRKENDERARTTVKSDAKRREGIIMIMAMMWSNKTMKIVLYISI